MAAFCVTVFLVLCCFNFFDRKNRKKMADTIAAIATASGNGSISILRVSGPESIDITAHFFYHSKKQQDSAGQPSDSNLPESEPYLSSDSLVSASTHTIHYGWFGPSPEELIDEVLVLIMRAPRSYTAEDVVEIQCHGGGLAAKKILELLLERGIRLAEPGEFTKRAFLNGRIDMTQAESVMEVIRSKSDLALETAEDHLRGDVRDCVRQMRDVILTDMAYLEAALDDPEHIELTDYPATLTSHLDSLEQKIRSLLKRSENGRMISEGIRTAIVGRPNVGKSSFLNCILREDRAIVTDVPGTTRDTLEEDVRIGSVLLRLIDTAGIRDTSDVVESIGVEKARSEITNADLIICVLDSSEPMTDEDRLLLEKCSDKPCIVLLNKSDLSPQLSLADVQKECAVYDMGKTNILEFSAETGDGLSVLEQLIGELFLQEFCAEPDCHRSKEPVITSLRQKEALRQALDSFDRIRQTMDAGMPEDLLTIDLLGSYEALGRVTGETVEDDLVEKIFHEFCMGK